MLLPPPSPPPFPYTTLFRSGRARSRSASSSRISIASDTAEASGWSTGRAVAWTKRWRGCLGRRAPSGIAAWLLPGRAKGAPDDLSGRGERQLRDELHDARILVGGEPRAHVFLE